MTIKVPKGQTEYYSRKLPGENIYSLCKAPFAGLEIGPDGNIVLCCMSSRNDLAHIDDVIDIGAGELHKLTDMLQYFKIDTKEQLAGESERLWNKADISFLKSLGWKPEVNLRKYITKNRRTN